MTAEEEEQWEDTPYNRIQLWFKYMTEGRGEFFDKDINPNLKLISASISPTDPNIAYATFEMEVPRALCNASGNLHGGAVATIFDTTTSMCIAPIQRPGFWDTGHVSRVINCSYLRPAAEGTVLLIENEVVHLGSRLAMLKGRMVRKSDGKVCYTCEHQKATTEFFKPKYNL